MRRGFGTLPFADTGVFPRSAEINTLAERHIRRRGLEQEALEPGPGAEAAEVRVLPDRRRLAPWDYGVRRGAGGCRGGRSHDGGQDDGRDLGGLHCGGGHDDGTVLRETRHDSGRVRYRSVDCRCGLDRCRCRRLGRAGGGVRGEALFVDVDVVDFPVPDFRFLVRILTSILEGFNDLRVCECGRVVCHVLNARRRPLITGIPVLAPDVGSIITAEVLYLIVSVICHVPTQLRETYRLNHNTHILKVCVYITRRRPKQRRRQAPTGRIRVLGNNIIGDALSRPVPDTDGLRGPLKRVDAAADGVEGVSVGVRVRGWWKVVAAGVVGGLIFGVLSARQNTVTRHQTMNRNGAGGSIEETTYTWAFAVEEERLAGGGGRVWDTAS